MFVDAILVIIILRLLICIIWGVAYYNANLSPILTTDALNIFVAETPKQIKLMAGINSKCLNVIQGIYET